MARNRNQCNTVEPTDSKIPAKIQHLAILSCTERLVHRLAHHIRRLSKLWFTHIFLLTMLISYAALGGLVFWTVEGYNERKERKILNSTKEAVQETLWNLSTMAQSLEHWKNLSHEPLEILERKVKQLGILYNPDKKVWSFWSAVFYSGTVFTTIGYGNITPSTDLGRALTIVYAIIGIPLLCTVLADFGKLLTICIKFFWIVIRRFSQSGSCRKSALPTKNDKVSSRAFLKRYEAENKLQVDSNNSCLEPLPSDKEENRENGEDEEGVEDVAVVSNPPVPYVIDDEFNLPISVALIILFAYIMLGGLIFFQWENWTYFESMYFVFISMSTIGFGDFVPEHPKFMMAAFAYLLFGLALMSMCINVVQETLTVTFTSASGKLKKRIGITDNPTATDVMELATQVEIAPIHKTSLKSKQMKEDIEAC